VLESDAPGAGCSTRNGGQISASIKPDYRRMASRYGTEIAKSVVQTGHNALHWIEEHIDQLEIDCAFQRCGRFYGAHSAKAFSTLRNKITDPAPGISISANVIPQNEQQQYIDSDHYYGGIIFHDHCSLDPGRYHQGLLQKAESLGVIIASNARVTGITGSRGQFVVQTTRGNLQASETIVATNGYSDNLLPWVRKRIIPIGSYMIATEALPVDTVKRLIPGGRVITDTRKLVVYYRPSPDNQRILFGARVSMTESDPARAVGLMHHELCVRFPELSSTKVSHSWMGFVAYTFDDMPHFGDINGIHYSMGYCGSGVSLSSYSGVQLAKKIIGQPFDDAFSRTEFESRFYYSRRPWFLAPSIAWYRFYDAFMS